MITVETATTGAIEIASDLSVPVDPDEQAETATVIVTATGSESGVLTENEMLKSLVTIETDDQNRPRVNRSTASGKAESSPDDLHVNPWGVQGNHYQPHLTLIAEGNCSIAAELGRPAIGEMKDMLQGVKNGMAGKGADIVEASGTPVQETVDCGQTKTGASSETTAAARGGATRVRGPYRASGRRE
jgi:hypothetical protein